MSASPNSSNKIAKFRTFAQDAEKHANQSIDQVRAANQTPAKNKDDQPKDQPDRTQPEVVDLDQVDTTETTEANDQASPIPKKTAPESKSPSETKKEPANQKPAAETDTDQAADKDISNPPFHKLDAERKKAAEKISSSSETISNHPESLLSGEKKQTVDVDDDEATAGATIVTDTKTSRKSVLTDIGDSVTGWFSNIKNTYITPPKPSYTVSKSERRAGILQDATGKTGTDLVDHDSFAARIRERYQNATKETAAVTTEPAWLPSLPAGNKRDISEVKTVPRKGVQTKDQEPQDASATTPSPTTTNQTSQETKQKTAATKKDSEATPEKTTTKPADQPTTPAPTPSKAAVAEAETTTKEDRPAKSPVATDINLDAAAPSTDKTDATPTKDTAAATTKDEPDTPDKAEPTTSTDAKATNASDQPATPTPTKTPAAPQPADAKPAAAEPADSPTSEPQPTAQPQPTTTAQVASDDYVLPSDQELDAEAVWADRQATNRLSMGIVLGTTVAVVAGVVVYSLAPLFIPSETETTSAMSTPFGSNTSTLAAADWSDTLARTQAVREAMNADIGTLTYVALTTTAGPVTDPGQFTQLLNIDMPVAVQTTGQALHAGNYRGTPFLYLHAPDTPQILGALLAWEASMSGDLQALLPINDHSGTFVDMVVSDTYDARVKQSATNDSILTYTIVGDYVLITTTPEAAETIVSAL